MVPGSPHIFFPSALTMAQHQNEGHGNNLSNNTWVESGRLRLFCLSGRGARSGEGGDLTKVEKKDEWQINEILWAISEQCGQNSCFDKKKALTVTLDENQTCLILKFTRVNAESSFGLVKVQT